jgi:hypothetical protein
MAVVVLRRHPVLSQEGISKLSEYNDWQTTEVSVQG